jgi:ATP-dependent Lon protease
LGTPIYRYDKVNRQDEVGLVTGLAWTVTGGETLSIEAIPLKGTGKLVLTGHLGEVMKESARAGFSYIRAKADMLGINPDFYNNTDIHIHIPEGAIPKDGPSAGVAMTIATISALTAIPVRKDVAMTGEITLRGRVLAIGGLKEKVLAAHRAGVSTVLIPSHNIKDLDEIPDNIKRSVKIIAIDHMDNAIEQAFPTPLQQKRFIEEASTGAENAD